MNGDFFLIFLIFLKNIQIIFGNLKNNLYIFQILGLCMFENALEVQINF